MKMKSSAKGITKINILMILLLCSQSGLLLSFGKKLKVISEKANIYLKPDKDSQIIGTLKKGAVLTLCASGKVRRFWYYVYFNSEEKGVTRSGYVLDSLVERLYKVTKIITIRGEGDKPKPRRKIALKTHFRGTFWGMRKNQVIELEGMPDYKNHSEGLEIIGFQQKVFNRDCLIEYIFMENKLTGAKYIFLDKYPDKNQYIDDYKTIKEQITQKYGEPEEDHVGWQNALYKDDYSKRGLALGLGHVEYSSQWETPETEILLTLFGNNSQISFEMEYTGIRFKELTGKVQEKTHREIW